MSPRATNILAILAAIVIAAAGLWYLQSRPDPDECVRWKEAVREQAELLASQQGGKPKTWFDDAARTFNEERPAGCDIPEESDRRL